jgi:hypothetical protein
MIHLDHTGNQPIRHCTPVKLGRSCRSLQFGRASVPMVPQLVHTMRGPKDGTVT